MKYWALVKDSKVTSIIVADQEFIDKLGVSNLGCDLIVDVTNEEHKPSPGFSYNGNYFNPPE